MPADRHEENQRYWNKWKDDPKFKARRREKNRAAAKRSREKKRLRDADGKGHYKRSVPPMR